MSQSIHALGIMNGTSLDGIDYSLIQVSSDLKKMTFKKHWQKEIPDRLKKRLLQAAQNELTTYDISELHFDLGRLYAKHLQQINKSSHWDIVGLHGQTVHHHGKHSSLQIGHPAFMSEVKSCPIYYDFRSADIVAGGQGAPFAPFFQNYLINNKKNAFAFHNLGGISNLTLFSNNKIQAFDTGPANILLDAWMQTHKKGAFDKNGDLSAKGLPDPICVNQFLKHPYFKKQTPKSTGREEFNLTFIKEWRHKSFKKLAFNDQMATLTELTALSIAQAYGSLKNTPQIIYFYGGGIFNSYLMERIQFQLPNVKIMKTDELGWPSQAFESSTFAFLAAARHFRKEVHLPQVTGAKKIKNLGSLYF